MDKNRSTEEENYKLFYDMNSTAPAATIRILDNMDKDFAVSEGPTDATGRNADAYLGYKSPDMHT